MAPQEKRVPEIPFPLYLAALVAALCGTLTVAAALNDNTFGAEMVGLILFGFAFSLVCRLLKVNSGWVEWVSLTAIVIAIAAALTGHLAWASLMPYTAVTNDERVAVVLCWGAVLLSWALMQDSTLLFTPLLAMATIGLVSSFYIGPSVVDHFFVLVVSTFFILTQAQSRRLRALAEQPEGPSLRGRFSPSRHLAVALLAAAILFLMGNALLLPTEVVTQKLSLASDVQRFGIMETPTIANGLMAPIRFTEGQDFDIGMGNAGAADTRVLMRVTPSDGSPHLWRARTYNVYNGIGWSSSLADKHTQLHPAAQHGSGVTTYAISAAHAAGRPLLSANFTSGADTNQYYYANEPIRISINASMESVPQYSEDGQLNYQDRDNLGDGQYIVVSALAPNPMNPAVQVKLQTAGKAYPPFITSNYLANMSDYPNGLVPQAKQFLRRAVAQALHGLPAKKRTPINETLAIRNWVSNRCIYSLDVAPLPLYEDHVYAFLDQTRRGYCDMFASSMAVMCRFAGIPARVATGFAPGDRSGNSYNLRVSDMHAWTEVYFPQVGWLDFDPTAGSRTDGSIPKPKETPQPTWRDSLAHIPLLPKIIVGCIAVLLLFVAVVELAARWKRRPVQTQSALRGGRANAPHYRKLLRVLSPLGIRRAPSETPTEFAVRAAHFLASQSDPAPSAQIVGVVIREFTGSFYGQIPEAVAPETDEALRVFAAEVRRLRLRLFWQRCVSVFDRRRMGMERG